MDARIVKFYGVYTDTDKKEVKIDLDDLMIKQLVDAAYSVTDTIAMIEEFISDLAENNVESSDKRWDLLYPRLTLVDDLDNLNKTIKKIKSKSKKKDI
jgi:hypothetical protein